MSGKVHDAQITTTEHLAMNPSRSAHSSTMRPPKNSRGEQGSNLRGESHPHPIKPPSRKQMSVLLLIVGAFTIAATLMIFGANESDVEHRHLEIDGQGGDPITDIDDDDYHKDGICRQYLKSFLNSTTDARDECEGLSNAYEAADCKNQNDRRLSFLSFDFRDDNDENVTDDNVPVMIDDYFENFQCCSWIHSYYTEHCRATPISAFALLFITVVLVLCGLVRNLLRIFDLKAIPEAAGCVIVGAIAGGFLYLVLPDGYSVNDVYFDKDFFLHILLPPIVFEAALGIDKKALSRHLFPVLVLAVVGTIMSSAFAGAIVYGLSSASTGITSLPLLESLLFGTIVATVDPVATLATFDSLGVGHTDPLYVLVFGESLLNDGVTIVLFDAIVSHLDKNVDIDSTVIWGTVEKFFVVIFASIGIGLGSTLLCTVYHWALTGKQAPAVEVAVFFCWAFIPFYLTEGLGYSGIVSILTAGFAMDIFIIGDRHYEDNNSEMQSVGNFSQLDNQEDLSDLDNQLNPEVDDFEMPRCYCWILPSWSLLQNIFSGKGHLSAVSKSHIDFVTQFVSQLMEMAIFAYLGVFLFSTKVHNDIALDWTAIFAAVSSRFVMIIILSMAINLIICIGFGKCCKNIFSFCSLRIKRDRAAGQSSSMPSERETKYINKWTQIILIFSGMRGAVSLALVESIPVYNAVTKRGSEYKSELKSMTTSTIIFTVFVFGCLTYSLLTKQQEIAERSVRPNNNITSQAEEPLITSHDGLMQSSRPSQEVI